MQTPQYLRNCCRRGLEQYDRPASWVAIDKGFLAGSFSRSLPNDARIAQIGTSHMKLIGTHVLAGAVAGTLLGLGGGVAYGATIYCSGGSCSGTPYPDNIYGTSGQDSIYGYGGGDGINAGAGADSVGAGGGGDIISGGDGPDQQVQGGDDQDTMHGNSGQDVLVGGAATDDIEGDVGNDLLYAADDCSLDYLYGGQDTDTCYVILGIDYIVNCENPVYQPGC